MARRDVGRFFTVIVTSIGCFEWKARLSGAPHAEDDRDEEASCNNTRANQCYALALTATSQSEQNRVRQRARPTSPLLDAAPDRVGNDLGRHDILGSLRGIFPLNRDDGPTDPIPHRHSATFEVEEHRWIARPAQKVIDLPCSGVTGDSLTRLSRRPRLLIQTAANFLCN